MAVGSQAMAGASKVYDYVKAAVRTTPGLKPVVEQLGQLFQKAVAARSASHKAQGAQDVAK